MTEPVRGPSRAPGLAPASLLTAGLLAVIAIVNVVQLPAIDRDADPPYEALPDYGTDELLAISQQHYPATERLFSVHLALREHARGATVELVGDTALSDGDLLGLGGAAEVRRDPERAPVELDAETRARVGAAIVADGQHDRGPWALAVLPDADGPPTTVVAFREDDRLLLVDRRLLP